MDCNGWVLVAIRTGKNFKDLSFHNVLSRVRNTERALGNPSNVFPALVAIRLRISPDQSRGRLDRRVNNIFQRCYIANKCLHGANVFDPNSLYSSSNTAIKKHPCPAVFAIQWVWEERMSGMPFGIFSIIFIWNNESRNFRARTNNQWRIVMQAKNGMPF